MLVVRFFFVGVVFIDMVGLLFGIGFMGGGIGLYVMVGVLK